MTHDPDTAIDYLSIPEAARHSLISESGLRVRVRNGTLPSKRVGPYRSIVVSRQALDALLLAGGTRRQTR